MVKSPFWKTTLAFCFGLTGIGAQAEPTVLPGAQPLQTIAALDVPRYMGTWYEIAKFPNWFQKKCIGATRIYWTGFRRKALMYACWSRLGKINRYLMNKGAQPRSGTNRCQHARESTHVDRSYSDFYALN